MQNLVVKKCFVRVEPLTPKLTTLSADLHDAIEQRGLLTVRSKLKLLEDLKELEAQSKEAERNARRDKAIDELLSSESSYIHQLKTIEIYFMIPIKEQGFLSADDYQTLFGNIRIIRNISEELLGKFEDRQSNIAEVFIEISPFLKVYSTYASYYKKSVNILLNAHSKRSPFFTFLELQESRPEVFQKLPALLIAPIQRIPRYCLLLQQILDNTNISDSSYPKIKEALAKIQEVVEYLDNIVGYQENAQRLIELQYSFKNAFPSIIKADRKLIKEGILKLSEKNKRLDKKYFILLTDVIIYCDILKSKINSINSLRCERILPLSKCQISDSSGDTFKLQCQDVELSISIKDQSQCQEWIDTITETIKTCLEHKRTLRKDSSSRRPVFGKHIGEYQEPGISPGIPRKKRQLDFDDDVDRYLPAKLTKRKCTANTFNGGEAAISVPKIKLPEYINTQGQDSLYPLRHNLIGKQVTFAENTSSPESPIEENTPEHPSRSEVYVFGSQNENRGFQFKLGSIFNSVGKSLKKLFGFK